MLLKRVMRVCVSWSDLSVLTVVRQSPIATLQPSTPKRAVHKVEFTRSYSSSSDDDAGEACVPLWGRSRSINPAHGDEPAHGTDFCAIQALVRC